MADETKKEESTEVQKNTSACVRRYVEVLKEASDQVADEFCGVGTLEQQQPYVIAIFNQFFDDQRSTDRSILEQQRTDVLRGRY